MHCQISVAYLPPAVALPQPGKHGDEEQHAVHMDLSPLGTGLCIAGSAPDLERNVRSIHYHQDVTGLLIEVVHRCHHTDGCMEGPPGVALPRMKHCPNLFSQAPVPLCDPLNGLVLYCTYSSTHVLSFTFNLLCAQDFQALQRAALQKASFQGAPFSIVPFSSAAGCARNLQETKSPEQLEHSAPFIYHCICPSCQLRFLIHTDL